MYPGLNDLGDALDALPSELIRHLTLLKEIEAKCVGVTPRLAGLISSFLDGPGPDLDGPSTNASTEPNGHSDIKPNGGVVETTTTSTNGSASPAPTSARATRRSQDLAQIRALVRELVPCLEEKMHVAGAAADTVKRLIGRIDYDYSLIINTNEIPVEIRTGEYNGVALHPAIVSGEGAAAALVGNGDKTAATSRSETRREAMAAKRAAHGQDGSAGADSSSYHGKDRGGRDYDKSSTPTGRRGGGASANSGGSSAKRSRNNTNNIAASEYASQVASGNSTPDIDYDTYGGVVSNNNTASTIGTTSNPKLRGARKAYLQAQQQSPEPEPTYCYCEQVSYGEMVACDGPDCKREWFHLPCIGLAAPPKGQWFCDDCATKFKRKRV